MLTILVGVVGARGLSKAHLMASIEKQGIYSSRLSLGVAAAGGLLQAC